MPKFNVKTVMFYGAMIGSVIVLFKAVTAYGETNLKAPPPIDGGYRLKGNHLPECLKTETLMLIVNQSGIYLGGSLLPVNQNGELEISVDEKPSLDGRWKKTGLSLSGNVPHLTRCNSSDKVKIEGTIKDNILTGKISLNSDNQIFEFRAKREKLVKETKNKGH
ncbi:MAG: hypothetical protein RLZZ338_3090 [Cyanobacteriota bacterium]|jgi:hypothetical protein